MKRNRYTYMDINERSMEGINTEITAKNIYTHNCK